MPATQTASNLSDTLVASIKQSQDLAASGISAWADIAGKAFTRPAFDSLPLGEQFPTPKELVDATFGFVEELLAAQKDFTYKVLEVVDQKR